MVVSQKIPLKPGSGLSGIVALGSNGEAAHLSTEERQLVTTTVRDTLNQEGYQSLPVIRCHEAAEAGGSHVLVLPPSYFKVAMSPDVIKKFYSTVADASPLPVIIYSFPAVVNDIHMSSELIIQISQHPNIVGTKFTCGDSGKLARVARAMHSSIDGGYWAVGGLADFTLQTMIAGGSGVVAGGANLAPKICTRIVELFKRREFDEAMRLQAILAKGDGIHTAAGIGATKAVLQRYFSYGGAPRLPLTIPLVQVMDNVYSGVAEMMELEKSL
ncbi:dihydrodipicolinate synthase [Exophiala viscosa]|uniref:dihydrodipicolinate synthase n=1 Tax=Exophiala viscosa TaxID=2486360 RepID=UPI0021916031|nr:dihydrodipicolinate synthase [Exophiala viscosa]